jgi:NitT/TauT family transport system substrate-binding protein
MKKFLLGLLALGAVIVLTACGSSEPEHPYLTRVRVGYNPGIGNILGFIAVDSGIAYAEGLMLEFVPFTATTDALNALQANRIDVAVSFGTAGPLTFITQGAGFTIFGGFLSGGMPIFAPPGFQYTGLESFAGLDVATGRMLTPDIVWRVAMHTAGYDLENDVNILEFRSAGDVLAAVATGNADVGIGTNSIYLRAREAGMEVIAWSNELWDPVHVCCRLVANTSWVNNNPDTVRAFLRTFLQAEMLFNDDPEYAVDVNVRFLGLDEENARTMLLYTNIIVGTDPQRNSIKYMWERMIDIGYLEPRGVDLDRHINIELYRQALYEIAEENPDIDFFRMLQADFQTNNFN